MQVRGRQLSFLTQWCVRMSSDPDSDGCRHWDDEKARFHRLSTGTR